VKDLLLSNALYGWKETTDGCWRVDRPSRRLLYSIIRRKDGACLPETSHGGRENLEAVEFLKDVNE